MCSVQSLDPEPLASLPRNLHAHTVLAAAPPVRPRRTRPHLCVRAHAIDPDNEIIPLLGPRRASFSSEELEALAHPRNTLGGKTIGEELGKKRREDEEASLRFFSSSTLRRHGRSRMLCRAPTTSSFPRHLSSLSLSPIPLALQSTALIHTQYVEAEASATKSEARLHTASKGGNWEGDVYVGGAWNELTWLSVVAAGVPLAGLVFAVATKGVLWGLVDYYGY